MARTVSIGNDDFADLRRYDSFYIDKTDFISEWWNSRDKVTLITRPRRFGKTLNLNMAERFFSNLHDDQEALFGSLAIWQDEEMRKLAGQFPVIFLSFAKIKNNNFTDTRRRLAGIVSEAYSVHRHLLH
ncbi:MAG: AAA family ATPase, partial [Firmicutes bacterium]|nr:AAA family ATPase [Bacillota bacterium]